MPNSWISRFRLVALSPRREAGVAGGGDQFCGPQRPGQLQAQQLVLAVVRLQETVRGDVAARVE